MIKEKICKKEEWWPKSPHQERETQTEGREKSMMGGIRVGGKGEGRDTVLVQSAQ